MGDRSNLANDLSLEHFFGASGAYPSEGTETEGEVKRVGGTADEVTSGSGHVEDGLGV